MDINKDKAILQKREKKSKPTIGLKLDAVIYQKGYRNDINQQK